jgi:hypothetical protein
MMENSFMSRPNILMMSDDAVQRSTSFNGLNHELRRDIAPSFGAPDHHLYLSVNPSVPTAAPSEVQIAAA